MNVETFYEIYIQNWINSNISDDIMNETKDLYEDYKKENIENPEEYPYLEFNEYLNEFGFSDGSLYASLDEFYENEYEIYKLASEIETFMYERGEYDFNSDIIRWIDSNNNREKTESNIRKDLEDDIKALINYFEDEVNSMDEEDELIQNAELILNNLYELQ